MAKNRTCDICKTPLPGKLGHGFVVNNGKSLVCGDYRRHSRMKKGRKFSYGEEAFKEKRQEVELG